MATLRQRLAARTVGDLVAGPGGTRTVADLRPAGAALRGARVAVSVHGLGDLVAALAALDGVAGTLVLLSDHLDAATAGRLIQAAGATVVVSDRDDLPGAEPLPTAGTDPDAGAGTGDGAPLETAWVLATSGTTGEPKLVPHTLASLSRTVTVGEPALVGARWGVVYDPTRFAGLQVVLQALLGDGVLLDTPGDAGSSVDALAALGCDHLSATPSVWRRLLMHPRLAAVPLRRVTLGGEAADDAVLRALARTFPAARVSHIYASTEAGVGFTVTDGRAGFPISYLQPGRLRGISLKVADGMLWLRVEGGFPDAATRPTDDEGYLCSGDLVEVTGDRVLFLGRSGSGVNVGGVVVYPEQVERLLLAHPHVRQCRVSSRPNRVTGALLEADVVGDGALPDDALHRDVVAYCRANLGRESVPRKVRIVPELVLSSAGKLVR